MKIDDDPCSATVEQEFDAISFKTFELYPRVLNPYRIISTLIFSCDGSQSIEFSERSPNPPKFSEVS